MVDTATRRGARIRRSSTTLVGVVAVVGLLMSPSAERPAPADATADEPSCGGQPTLRTNGLSWTCAYDDEFDDGIDRDTWSLQETAGSEFVTGTSTRYACYTDDDRVASVSDGLLRLSLVRLAEERDCGDGQHRSRYLAASLSHYRTYSQTYGRYEVRAKLPDLRTAGSQTTFWLWPDDVHHYGTQWPDSGEIDFAEAYSQHPDLTVPVMHYRMGTVDQSENRNVYTSHSCAITYGEFNTYVVEWTPNLIRIEVDGRTCIENHYDATNAPEDHPAAPFDQPFFLNLTQAMGGDGNAYTDGLPATLTTEVDHVRIWTWDEAATDNR